MKRSSHDSGKATGDPERLAAEIGTGAHGDDEQLWALPPGREEGCR
ncbi:MAG TPA: hypothetical protein VLF66_02075 [Thermoanaerobaculia bacterium]|jgi:hypothetical protein|nr:hypothetical protein [Thermoanaerobaculia bacterium]